MAHDLEEIKQIPIKDVAQDLGINVRGNACRCINSNHEDKHPSMVLYPENNRFKCMVCPDVRGSNIDLVMIKDGVSFKEAVRYLGERWGVKTKGKIRERARQTVRKQIWRPFFFNPDHSDLYQSFLSKCELTEQAIEYLEKRGLSWDLVSDYKVTVLTEPQKTYDWMVKEHGENTLKQVGFLSREGKFLFYHHRLLFPFVNKGKVVFIQGRRADSQKPKYMSLAVRPVPALYNEDILDKLNPGEVVYICEGIIDTLSAIEIGLNAVGVLGTSNFRPEWVRTLHPFNVKLIGDSDEAGSKFNRYVTELFLKEAGKVVKTVHLEGAGDLNEFISR